jgi:hypothetical protein
MAAAAIWLEQWPCSLKGIAMQKDQQVDSSKKRKEDEDEDRAVFFWFPFFRGRRVEMIPSLLLLALFLWFALYNREAPAPKEAIAPQPAVAALPEPVKVETQRWGSSVIFPIEGKDGAGRGAAFDVAVLPKELSWVSKSSTQLANGGEIVPDDQLAARLFTQELRDGLGQSKQVIAIGLASQEGQVEEETQRAASRAQTAAGWLSNAVAPETGIWLLNLGQFKRTGCKAQTETTDTSWQRPVILVGIKSQDEGTDLVQAFADAISGKSNLPSRDCYSSFDLTRFR